MATSSDDGTVRLWDAATGAPRWRGTGLRAPGELARLGRWIRLSEGGPGAVLQTPSKWRRAVALRARHAALSVDGGLLCLSGGDGLELWDPRRDRLLAQRKLGPVTRLLALGDGCVTLVRGELSYHRITGARRRLAEKVGGVGPHGLGLLYATRTHVTRLDRALRRKERFAVAPGVVALAHIRDLTVLGFRDGGIEIARSANVSGVGPGPGSGSGATKTKTKTKSTFTFESTPASPVTLLRAGPRGTILAGFANGHYGLWSWPGGTPLLRRRLHGPVVDGLHLGTTLHVATALGQHDSLSLAAFERPYCDLLREVWRRVQVGWSQGRPALPRRPRRHRCLK